jgi:hypothetical protein
MRVENGRKVKRNERGHEKGEDKKTRDNGAIQKEDTRGLWGCRGSDADCRAKTTTTPLKISTADKKCISKSQDSKITKSETAKL